MQLNGTIAPTMAASEPPELPPRNPEKIDASLGKQINSDAKTKSVETSDRPVNNNKPFKSIISLDGTTTSIESTIQSTMGHIIDNSHNKKLASNNIDSTNESTTIKQSATTTEYLNGDDDDGGSASNSNPNENNVISKDEGGMYNYTAAPAIETNNKYQQITIDKSNANNIQPNNSSNSDDDIGNNGQLELNNKETRCGDRNDDINSVREHSFDSEAK